MDHRQKREKKTRYTITEGQSTFIYPLLENSGGSDQAVQQKEAGAPRRGTFPQSAQGRLPFSFVHHFFLRGQEDISPTQPLAQFRCPSSICFVLSLSHLGSLCVVSSSLLPISSHGRVSSSCGAFWVVFLTFLARSHVSFPLLLFCSINFGRFLIL